MYVCTGNKRHKRERERERQRERQREREGARERERERERDMEIEMGRGRERARERARERERPGGRRERTGRSNDSMAQVPANARHSGTMGLRGSHHYVHETSD